MTRAEMERLRSLERSLQQKYLDACKAAGTRLDGEDRAHFYGESYGYLDAERMLHELLDEMELAE